MNWEDKLEKKYLDESMECRTLSGSFDTLISDIESLLKKRDDALKTLAMIGLQSRCYEEYIDFRLAVDNALEIIKGGSDG